MIDLEQQVAERFVNDVSKHEMAVLQNDGLYRHLRFKQPDTGSMWFDIITWPGLLTIQGDMGCYVFSRITDMFDFFHGPNINPRYWGEKLQADSGYRGFSDDALERRMKEDFDNRTEDYTESERADIWEQIENEVLVCMSDWEVRDALDRFNYEGFDYRDHDTWEWDFENYKYQYLWCCYAIKWAIEQYRAQS